MNGQDSLFLKVVLTMGNSEIVHPKRPPCRKFRTVVTTVTDALSLCLALSNPIFLPTTYSPALIYFGQERVWWITCNYPTVLKEKNINMNSPDDFIIYFRLHKIIKVLFNSTPTDAHT